MVSQNLKTDCGVITTLENYRKDEDHRPVMAFVETEGIGKWQSSCRGIRLTGTKGWKVDTEALEMFQKTLADKILADDSGMVKDNVNLSNFQEVVISTAGSVKHTTAASRHKIEREEPADIIRLRLLLGDAVGEERRKICHKLNKERRKWSRQKAECMAASAKVSYEGKPIKTMVIN